ncbi:hypothetical protein [Intrasporangium sp.]|uniref:hypothetical protein n=1 Tax=Intrasporangium sp. TaxID=1925024 RepID=UPI0032217642
MVRRLPAGASHLGLTQVAMATCPQGMAHDRRVTGYDHTTAVNPAPLQVGDLVRSGADRQLWRVRALWEASPFRSPMVDLDLVDGYGFTSVGPARLRVVERPRPSDARADGDSRRGSRR